MNEQELLRRLQDAFQEESAERINAITTKLVDLENVDDDGRQDVLEEIYREAHSLKGAARAVNLFDIENVCQAVESVFGALKRKEIKVNTALFDILHDAIRIIECLLSNDSDAFGPEVDITVERLLAVKNGDKVEAESSPEVSVAPVQAPEKPAVAAAPLEDSGEPSPAEEPPLPVMEAAEPVVVPAAEPSPLEERAPAQDDQAAPKVEREGKSTVRLNTDKLDSLLLKAEEMIALKLAASEQQRGLQQSRTLLEQMHELFRSAEQDSESVNVEAQKQRLLTELQQNMQGLIKASEQNKRFVGKMVDDLLDDMKSITMLPLTTLTDIFPRMVRDIAREQNKDIELKMSGTEVEIDRRILEELKDPLIHLLRNSIDHGIEEAPQRQKSKKAAKARLELAIELREDGNVDLHFSDDGKGLDVDKLVRVAVSKGLISEPEAALLSREQCCNLIFLSGVSTSDIITQISGRGLGMAIVQEKIEQLGGAITLDSVVGEGTTFKIQLPVSLATFRGILIAIGDRKFIVSSNQVDSVLNINRAKVETIEKKPTIPFQGKSLPLVDLDTVLGMPARKKNLEESMLKIVVLGTLEKRIGFLVDEVINEQEILVKGLGKQLVRVRNIAGATILGSGEIVPVLNVRDLMLSAVHASSAISRVGEVDEDEQKKSILVAEDSITSRMLLKNILEAAGYAVTTTVDGQDALTSLRNNPVDLVVSDVEMPRMNGFELTTQIRQDEQLKDTPLVLVTSLSSAEDKERGVEAGATAYIVKSSFDQGNLVEVIGRLI